MRKWVARQIPMPTDRAVVAIDRSGIATEAECVGDHSESVEVVRARDWYELRRAWEYHGRHAMRIGPVVIVVTDVDIGSPVDLPYDIAKGADVAVLRVPVGPSVQSALLALDDVRSDEAVDRIETEGSRAEVAILGVAAQLPSPLVGSDRGPSEFRAALRLRARTAPTPIIELARSTFSDMLAQALLADPPDTPVVHDAWSAFVDGDVGDQWRAHFDEAAGEIAGLFLSGALRPVASERTDLPRWATVGIADVDAAERVSALLDAVPDGSKCVSFEDWVAVAQWWAQVRHGLAVAHPAPIELSESAWATWAELDAAFLAWLRAHYGEQLSRSWVNGPVSVDKIQPFIARQRQVDERILLVVLDGCGLTQWAHVVETAPLRVVRPGAALAMIPTLTSVSRQAIAAGTTPNGFADSIDTTTKESQRWSSAWSDEGVTAAWLRIGGARVDELDAVPFSTSEVIGLVVSAPDELMHGAELLGDAGFHSGVEAWLRGGAIGELIARAEAHHFTVWVTADHGNLEVVPTPSKREGVFLDRSGTRVRRYQNRVMRDGAAVDGLTWDDIPGLPVDEAEQLLFAPGRVGWGSARVSHGGLSLDEVIVPFVQVAAP